MLVRGSFVLTTHNQSVTDEMSRGSTLAFFCMSWTLLWLHLESKLSQILSGLDKPHFVFKVPPGYIFICSRSLSKNSCNVTELVEKLDWVQYNKRAHNNKKCQIFFSGNILTAGFNSWTFPGQGKGVPADVSGLMIPRDPGLALPPAGSVTLGTWLT